MGALVARTVIALITTLIVPVIVGRRRRVTEMVVAATGSLPTRAKALAILVRLFALIERTALAVFEPVPPLA